MTSGLLSDLLSYELLRLQVDIVALQEMDLTGTGTLQEKDYTFFWQGKSAKEHRERSRFCSEELSAQNG